MSRNQGITQFVPNYVTKSDYLPTRIIDGNNSQTSELVPPFLTSSDNINRKKGEAEFSPKDPSTSIPNATSPTKSTKPSELISPSTKSNSAASFAIDLIQD